jgi:hypothetical protein
LLLFLFAINNFAFHEIDSEIRKAVCVFLEANIGGLEILVLVAIEAVEHIVALLASEFYLQGDGESIEGSAQELHTILQGHLVSDVHDVELSILFNDFAIIFIVDREGLFINS